MSKIKHIWLLNLVVFASVVFLGIEQAGRGAEISNIEGKIEDAIILKRDLSERIFENGSDTKLAEKVNSLGFIKPTEVRFIKTESVFASLSVR